MTKPARLTRLTITPYVPIPDPLRDGPDEEDAMWRVVASELLQRHGVGREKLIWFLYAHVDRHSGFMGYDYETGFKTLLEGDDRRGYDELMDVVRGNQRRLGVR